MVLRLLGLLFLILGAILLRKNFKSIFQEIKNNKELFWIVLLRELFLGASGIYMILLFLGGILLAGIGQK